LRKAVPSITNGVCDRGRSIVAIEKGSAKEKPGDQTEVRIARKLRESEKKEEVIRKAKTNFRRKRNEGEGTSRLNRDMLTSATPPDRKGDVKIRKRERMRERIGMQGGRDNEGWAKGGKETTAWKKSSKGE